MSTLGKITNVAKWIKILDELGIDIKDFDLKGIAKLAGDGGEGIGDILDLFKNKDDVDEGGLTDAIENFGGLGALLGDADDEDDDNSLLGSLLGGGDDDEGGLLGSVLDKLL